MADPTGTNGDISVDPLFVLSPTPGDDGQWGTADDEPGDLHLKTGSLCVDAGDTTAVAAGSVDLDGGPRIFGVHVDIGVDEFMPGDFNNDNRVNQSDFELFKACFSGPMIPYANGCQDRDLDGDNDIDQSDFGLFQVLLAE